MTISIKKLKKGRKHVFEEINRNKIRLMNAINQGKYRDDNEKRKIINQIDEVQAEAKTLPPQVVRDCARPATYFQSGSNEDCLKTSRLQ